jgi:hypothetical protein
MSFHILSTDVEARIIECTNIAKEFSGDDYARRMEMYSQIIKSAANSMEVNFVHAAYVLAEQCSGSRAAIFYFAALGEVISEIAVFKG